MNVLAIETATTLCAIGLARGTEYEVRILDDERRHTEVLVDGIASLLKEFSLTPRDLDRVVVDRGPGLFTGLRVGLATGQGLASALGIDAVGVTSLELLAHGAHASGVRGHLVALVDGRRGEVFAQVFSLTDDVEAVSTHVVTTALDVAIEWGTSGRPVKMVGDGAARYADVLAPVPNVEVLSATIPSLEAALAIGAVRAPGELRPLYLREADAVANFTTRQRPS